MKRDSDNMKVFKDDTLDLKKYLNIFVSKATKSIVESRLGEKISTPCTEVAEWFYVNTSHLPEVDKELKERFKLELFLNKRVPFCVQTYFETAEGDRVDLENWCMQVLPPDKNETGNIANIYMRMGILMKSLMSVARATPAYMLSRRQGEDVLVILYLLYMGEPKINRLGEKPKKSVFGNIATKFGTLQLSCTYRTKMTIPPTQNSMDNSIMLKSDHFNAGSSPRNKRYSECDDHKTPLVGKIKYGAFANTKEEHYPKLEFDLPFCGLLTDRLSLIEQLTEDVPQKLATSPSNENERENESESQQKTESEKNEKNGNLTSTDQMVSMRSTGDDFIMVDLHLPFARSSMEQSELSEFFRKCVQWPTGLDMFQQQAGLDMTDVQKQLDIIGKDLSELSGVVQRLCQNDSPNNN